MRDIVDYVRGMEGYRHVVSSDGLICTEIVSMSLCKDSEAYV